MVLMALSVCECARVKCEYLWYKTVADPGEGAKGAMPPPSTLVKDYLFGPSGTKYLISF